MHKSKVNSFGIYLWAIRQATVLYNTQNYSTKEQSFLTFSQKTTTKSEPMADPSRGDTDKDSSAHPHPFHGIVPLSIPPTPLIFFSNSSLCNPSPPPLTSAAICVSAQKKSLLKSSRIHVSNAPFKLIKSQNKIHQIQNQYSLTYSCSFTWSI